MQLSDRKFGRLLQMQLPELVYRGKQETYKLLDRVRADYRRGAGSNRDDERFALFVEGAKSRFFAGVFDPSVKNALEATNADDCQTVLVRAHRAAQMRFDLLGYRDLDFGDPIDWQLDPVSGRRAPRVHWSRLNALDAESAGDAKVIWELNRHQWLVHLAIAWKLTGDLRYAASVVYTIRQWIRDNPPGMGINWASSLEVSFRLIAWCWALLLVYDSGVLTSDLFHEIERSAEQHAQHVQKYLSTYFSPNTHLTGEALGLFYAGVLFSSWKNARELRALGSSILEREIERQVLSDGVYFERSTCYQRYTADIYLQYVALAERAHVSVAPIVRERLRSLVDVLVAVRQPDGRMPHIGDADGGVLLPLSLGAPDDYRSTFSTAAVLFRDPSFARAAGRIAADTVWLFGSDACDTFAALMNEPGRKAVSRIFPVGGFVVMRSDEQQHALVFDAGPIGRDSTGAHAHASLLSVQCSAFGEPFIVDAGTCCYTADIQRRNYFRSTAAHSTVSVDGLSQAEPAGPFAWKRRCTATLLQWKLADALTYADALSDAYKRLQDPVSHRRRVAFVQSKFWIVFDELCGSARHTIDLRFQFAPMEIRTDDSWVRATRDGKRGLLVRAFAAAEMNPAVRQGRREPMEGWLSSDYGCMQPAPALVYTAETKLPLRIATVLWPAEDLNATPDVECLVNDRGLICGIRTTGFDVMFTDDDIYVRNRGNH